MSTLKIHTIESAPEGSKESLKGSIKAFGMLPNLHGVLAGSPATLEAYKKLHELFSTKTAFNAEEKTVIWQTINVEHECHYCVPAHTAIAGMMEVDGGITEALRNDETLADNKLQVLKETTLEIVRSRGNLSKSRSEAFFSAGYTQQQLIEIILGVSQKTISNYLNHIAETPVDEPFQKFAWEKANA